MGDKEDGHGAEGKLSHDQLLTNPDEAVKFVQETRVDALAIAMGTSHGAYKFTRKPDGDILAMVKAARHAGRSLKRDLGEIEHLQVSMKGPANFVTLADKRAEEILYTDLAKARPGYGFIGEEGGVREGADKSHTWIVDPLDGTTNFLHELKQWTVGVKAH